MKRYDRSLLTPDPFDGSAPVRLRRMGLLNADGSPDTASMRVFIQIFAGQYFDDLCDHCSDREDLLNTVAFFSELAARNDFKKIYLFLAFQYDRIRKPMPDPVWWLAGHLQSLEVFSLGFAARLAELAVTFQKEEPPHDQTTDCCSD